MTSEFRGPRAQHPDPPATDTEAAFLASYDARKYPVVSYTADFCAFAEDAAGDLCVLLVERGNHPFKGMWALPGGYVDVDEDSLTAAVRELAEETTVVVDPGMMHQLRTYDKPNRDPRSRVVTTAYCTVLSTMPEPVASDDARQAHWWPVNQLPLNGVQAESGGPDGLAFDHATILEDALGWYESTNHAR